jgi:exosortase D (VPLPA-CTERM-specific)
VTQITPPSASENKQSKWLLVLWIAAVVLLIYVYRQVLGYMLQDWQREEFSHGYLIPLVTLFLIWQRINQVPAITNSGSWWGLTMLALGLLCYPLGELSTISTLIQYGFLLSLTGISWAFFGTQSMRLLWAAFFYLIFMIPVPHILYYNLSSQLQLFSSVIGVAVIRLFDISVHLEGNVIDLGSMQLQVAEACSGLRYLFPLMSFGFLIGYLYRGAIWQRMIIFLSTIPITILMNSFRIGVIGVTVDKWGLEMAQGFLHAFEGWVVFMGCITLLFIEIALFQVFAKQRRKVFDLINLDVPKLSIKLSNFNLNTLRQHPFLFGVALLVLVTPFFATLKERAEVPPVRQSFVSFPLRLNEWTGHEGAFEKDVLGILQASDIFIADYQYSNDSVPVNFYSAWYATQTKNASIHSPRSCLPGGGWRVESFDQYDVPGVKHPNGQFLRVNRVFIQKGNDAQLVYYWFDGRNRDITNEYVAKWFNFVDSLTQARSDGALIRVVTIVPAGSPIELADQRLQHFLKDFYPTITAYVP